MMFRTELVASGRAVETLREAPDPDAAARKAAQGWYQGARVEFSRESVRHSGGRCREYTARHGQARIPATVRVYL